MQCSSLRDKCPYSEFLWPVFSSIRKEYVSLRIQYAFSPNAGKYGPENSEYGHFSRNGYVTHWAIKISRLSVSEDFILNGHWNVWSLKSLENGIIQIFKPSSNLKC